ncbi:MAG: MBL fold metallo-hydrolase [Phycisphaerae bacterium]
MALKFYFLGSGSRGNCTLVETSRGKFLIDLGFGLKRTNQSLHELGMSMEEISVALLTHTHNDHVKNPTLRRMAISNVPLMCRSEHQSKLSGMTGFNYLQDKELVHFYSDSGFEVLPDVFVEPIALSHDSPATHGFLFTFKMGTGSFRFAYIADCGFFSLPLLIEKIQDVDLIALEFNHDEQMEKESGRHPQLIHRVIGPTGHLSNYNAAKLLNRVKAKNLKSVVQLHLSEECNLPRLAQEAAGKIIANIPIHQTAQEKIGPIIEIR